MKEKLKSLEFKRLFQEYTFLSIDEEYKKEYILENNSIFMEAARQLLLNDKSLQDFISPSTSANTIQNESEKIVNNQVATLFLDTGDFKLNLLEWFINKDDNAQLILYSADTNNNQSEKKQQTKITDDATKEKAKNLYRKIAKKTHPDKIGSNQFADVYVRAKIAYENYDLIELYSICVQLGLAHSVEDSDKIDLELRIKDKKGQITTLEKSYVWLWMMQKEENFKQHLLRAFVVEHSNKFKSFFGL